MSSTPKFILSKKKVLEQFDIVKEISDIVSYSSKTNPIVTGILESDRDCLFSVHSKNELKNIKDKSRIIFLCQGWNKEEVDYLYKLGIRYFVVDNICDLETLKNYIKSEMEINLFLRLKLKENTLQTEKHFVFGFRSDYINSEIIKLKNLVGIKSVGIHFHRKTQNMAEWEMRREIENVILPETLKLLDCMVIGGGLPSVYANTNIKVFDSIFKKIKEMRAWLNSNDIKMIVEPGRFIAASSVKLITNVKAIHENNIIVDASVYNTDMDALIVPVKLLIEGELEKGEGSPYIIKGITPCSMDLFRYKVYLKDVKVGDKIIFLNAGAYNFRTDFCDLKKIETEIIY